MSAISTPRPSIPAAVPALDGVRGLAALLVVLTHIGYQTGETTRGAHGALLARADFGVALFFVLSGLLLYRPWAAAELTGRAAPPWRTYLRRRALRILPAYWVALVAVLLAAPRGSLDGGDVISNATLTQIYGAGHLLPDFTQTWSLCTEVTFYLALPLVAGAVARLRSPAARLAVFAAVILLSLTWTALAAADHLPAHAGTWLPGHASWFALGMLLAALLVEARRAPDGWAGSWLSDFGRRPGTLLFLAVGVAAIAATPLAGPRTLAPPAAAGSVVKEALYGVVALLVIAAALVAAPDTPLARWLGSPPARWCGHVSYGVFLWHLLVLDAAMRLLGTPLFGGDFVRVAAVTVPGSLLAGWLSWLLVERWLLDRFSQPVSSNGRPGPLPGEEGEQRKQGEERRPAASGDRV
jgi:peptidoglycan/LPS O-acetylase OafA/YrhL